MILLTMVLAGCAARTPRGTPPDPSIRKFVANVEQYVRLRDQVIKGVPPQEPTDTPAAISARERALADAILPARAGASEGDVFGPAGALLAQQVAEDWRRRSASDRRGLTEELAKAPRPRHNTRYPTEQPFATVPPDLLLRLPALPDTIEYRLVGPHLILRDTLSNVIVDVLPDAVHGGTGQAGRR